MKRLEQVILEKGKILPNNVLKIDSFLNHQVDPKLTNEMALEFYEHFKNKGITKVLTVESSGIAPAIMCAYYLDVPMVFIKKTLPSTMMNPLSTTIHSFTKNKDVTICVDSEFICEDDKILFIDDFLANGEAYKGVEKLVEMAKATIAGVGIVVEKSFQQGHQYLVDSKVDFIALASIKKFENGIIEFSD